MKWIAQWPREGIEFDSQADVEGLIKGEPKNPEPSPWETRVLVIEAILSDLPRIGSSFSITQRSEHHSSMRFSSILF